MSKGLKGLCHGLILLAALGLAPQGALASGPLRIGFAQWPGFDVIWYGVAERLFERRGVEVQFIRMDHQKDATRALLRGRIDGAFTTLWDLYLAGDATDRVEVVLVANVSHGSDGLVAGPGLNAVSELRGKTVAARLGTVNQLILAEAMALHGLGPGEIDVVDVSNDIANDRLLAGQVDAAVLWQPLLGEAAARSGGHVLFTTADVDSLVIDTLSISKSSAANRNADWRRFMLAWLDIMQAIDEAPDAVFQTVGEVLGQPAEEFARDYAGLIKGDAALNRRQFGPNGTIYSLYDRMERMVGLFPSYPIALNRDITFDGDLILGAVEEWSTANGS